MFWLKYIQGLIKAFHGDISPNQLAAGFAIGAILGLTPKFNLLALALWALILFFRVHFGMATAAVVIFSVVGAVTDPVVERFGYFLLTGVPALHGLWTALYNLPIVPFSAFNNSLVLGNFVVGCALTLPVFFLFRRLVLVYRERLREKVMRWKIMQAFKASAIYDLYDRWINR